MLWPRYFTQTHEIFTQKNQSLCALWIFFQNYFCIFRSRMASFLYIYFGMKHQVLGSGACLSAIADPWKHVWAGVTACFVYKQQHADMFLSTIVQFWGILKMQWFWIFSQDHFYLQWWGYRCEVWVLTSIACVLGGRSKSSCQNWHVKNLS